MMAKYKARKLVRMQSDTSTHWSLKQFLQSDFTVTNGINGPQMCLLGARQQIKL